MPDIYWLIAAQRRFLEVMDTNSLRQAPVPEACRSPRPGAGEKPEVEKPALVEPHPEENPVEDAVILQTMAHEDS